MEVNKYSNFTGCFCWGLWNPEKCSLEFMNLYFLHFHSGKHGGTEWLFPSYHAHTLTDYCCPPYNILMLNRRSTTFGPSKQNGLFLFVCLKMVGKYGTVKIGGRFQVLYWVIYILVNHTSGKIKGMSYWR